MGTSRSPGSVLSDELLEEVISLTLQTSSMWMQARFSRSEDGNDSSLEDELWLNLTDVVGWLLQIAPDQAMNSPTFVKLLPFLRFNCIASIILLVAQILY